MSDIFSKTIAKLVKKDLVTMAVNQLTFITFVQDTITKIITTTEGTFENNEDPLEWSLAQLRLLLQNERFASATVPSDKQPVAPSTKNEALQQPTTSANGNQQTQPTQPPPSTVTIKPTNLHTNEHLDDDDLDSVNFNYNRFPHRQYKLPPNTPMFMADGRTCDDWLFVFENALQASSVPDHMILPLLSSYVTGTALQLLKLHMNDTLRPDWRSFKVILRSTFQPVDHIFRTRQKLVALKQGSDSIDTYNKNYLRLSTQLEMRFDDLLFHYTNGLSERLKYEVMSKNPRSMDEALAIATQYDHLHARNPVDVNTLSVKHNRHNQGSSSGSRRFIPTVTPRTDKPSCSYCHKRGHTFNDCYSRQNASKTHSSKSSFAEPHSRSSALHSAPAAPQPSFRRHNGPPGHKGPRGMNTLHTSNSNQLLRVHGAVSHIPNLLCTLDTASAVSMMTVSTARQHGFAIFPSDITNKSANKAVTPVVGVTDELQIDIHGHSCSISFIVLDHDDHELLLGT